MAYGLILQIASITLVVVFVALTEARPITKAAAVLVLVLCTAGPRFVSGIAPISLALKAALSIGIIFYLKLQGFTL